MRFRIRYLFMLAFLIFIITTIASAAIQQINILVNIPPSLTGNNLFFVIPLKVNNSVITNNNFYVINNYGYYEYSYLFSSTPPLLTLYQSQATNTTYYVTFGNGITPQYVSTNIYSNLFTFYLINTTIFNASGVTASAGIATFANNSHLWFQPSTSRYIPSSVLFLYNILPSATLSVSPLIYSGQPLQAGAAVFFNLFQSSTTYTFSAQYLNVPYLFLNYLQYPTLQITNNQVAINNFPPVPVKPVSEVIVTQNETIVSNVTFHTTPIITPSSSFSTTYIATFTAIYSQTGSSVYGLAPLIFTQSMLNGSNLYAIENGKFVTVGTAPSSLSLVSNPQMFVVNLGNNPKNVTLYGVPIGSTIAVTYSNGTTKTFIAQGQVVNNVGPLKLTNYGIPAGSGITTMVITLPGSQEIYTAQIGFTDFVHAFYVNLTNGFATVDVNGTQLVTLGKVVLPANIVIGTQQVGSNTYLLGLVQSYTGQVYNFLVPLNYPVYNVVPYVKYVTYTGQPLLLTEIGVYPANGLFYTLNGQIKLSVSTPYPITATVETVVTSPGLTLSINNGKVNVYTNSSASSSNLIIEGANGYELQLIYQNVQTTTPITSNYYSVQIPSNMPALVSVDPSSRIIIINANAIQQQQAQYINQKITLNQPLNVTIAQLQITPIKVQLPTVSTNQIVQIVTNYAYAAFGIYLINRNLEITNTLWYGSMLLSLLGFIVAIVISDKALTAMSLLLLVVSFGLRYIGK
ncbi:MAG: hypothetical protein QW046_04115 [Candidatus Micrarchaeaceae archaeon]|uniref:hypothetical protein n=1 Tax=Metallosphaera sp. TaxID=2020860 RepID=UPI0031625A4B